MATRQKNNFELVFPIISTNEHNLFEDESAYFSIKAKYEEVRRLLIELPVEKAYLGDFYRNRIFIYSRKVEEITTIREDTLWVLNYLQDGGIIKAKHHRIYDIFIGKELRKRLYILRDITLDEKPCNTIPNLEILARQCQIIMEIDKMAELWSIMEMEFESLVEKYKFIGDINKYAKDALIAYELGASALEQTIKEQNLLL